MEQSYIDLETSEVRQNTEEESVGFLDTQLQVWFKFYLKFICVAISIMIMLRVVYFHRSYSQFLTSHREWIIFAEIITIEVAQWITVLFVVAFFSNLFCKDCILCNRQSTSSVTAENASD